MPERERPDYGAAPEVFDLARLDLARLLEVIDASDLTMLRVRTGGTEILVTRGGARPPEASEAPRGSPARDLGAPDASQAEPGHAPRSPGVADRTDPDVPDSDLVSVRAPLIGTFYRSPEPGGPPYVEIGSPVEVGQTIGLVEAMKVFSAVSSSAQGTVEAFLVADLDVVQYGQEICRVRPVE